MSYGVPISQVYDLLYTLVCKNGHTAQPGI